MEEQKSLKKLFIVGNEVNVSTKAYATMYNRFLIRIKSNRKPYSLDLINEHNDLGKKNRPVIVVWANKYHNKVILIPQTTSNTSWNEINSYRIDDRRYWKYEVLVLDIEKTHIIENRVWKQYNKFEVEQFLEAWKNNSKFRNSYSYLEVLITKYSDEVRQKLMEEFVAIDREHNN